MTSEQLSTKALAFDWLLADMQQTAIQDLAIAVETRRLMLVAGERDIGRLIEALCDEARRLLRNDGGMLLDDVLATQHSPECDAESTWYEQQDCLDKQARLGGSYA